MEKEPVQTAVNISRPKQWDSAFDATMLSEDVDRLLRVEPFRSMDSSKFPKAVSLRDILLYETRIRQFKKGDIVYRQGDFAVSAFLVLAGSLRSVFDLPEQTFQIKTSKVRKIYNSIKRALLQPTLPEVRDIGQYGAKQDSAYVSNISNKHEKIDLTDLESFTKAYRSEVHPAATLLGEVALMSRSPHAMTVVAAEQTELLEIKWQGFRELMKYDNHFKSLINNLYQDRSLSSYLRSNPMFEKVSDNNIKEIIANTTFEAYGKFDWHIDFNKLKNDAAQDKIQQEQEIIREGDYADDILIIRSGFARITQKYGTGLKTLGYLKAGEVFGMELLDKTSTSYPYSLRSIGHTDVLRIPVSTIKKYIEINSKVTQSFQESNDPVKQDLLGFFIDGRYMNGTQTMLINLDRCTGCDDCVTACARNHDNNPRFIRHGNVHNNFMVANSCMHCHDPVCLIGCPTGAIHRHSELGQIIINDQTCIGCMTCANSCPYNNIRMVNVRNESGEVILDEQYTPILKATKCDLCLDQAVTPACEYACPHNALKRVDIHNIKKLKAWLD